MTELLPWTQITLYSPNIWHCLFLYLCSHRFSCISSTTCNLIFLQNLPNSSISSVSPLRYCLVRISSYIFWYLYLVYISASAPLLYHVFWLDVCDIFFPVLLRYNWPIKIICYRCTTQCYDICIHCAMITTIKLINIAITSYSYKFFIMVGTLKINFQHISSIQYIIKYSHQLYLTSLELIMYNWIFVPFDQ